MLIYKAIERQMIYMKRLLTNVLLFHKDSEIVKILLNILKEYQQLKLKNVINIIMN